MTLIYLACPYDHPDPKVRRVRVSTATRMTAFLTDAGASVYSPLTHSAELVKLKVHKSGPEWLMIDLPFLEAAHILFVLTLPGWQESEGVGKELILFRERGKPIFFISPDYGKDTIFATWSLGG